MIHGQAWVLWRLAKAPLICLRLGRVDLRPSQFSPRLQVRMITVAPYLTNIRWFGTGGNPISGMWRRRIMLLLFLIGTLLFQRPV